MNGQSEVMFMRLTLALLFVILLISGCDEEAPIEEIPEIMKEIKNLVDIKWEQIDVTS